MVAALCRLARVDVLLSFSAFFFRCTEYLQYKTEGYQIFASNKPWPTPGEVLATLHD